MRTDKKRPTRASPRSVPLNRALSKLGILSRAQAIAAIRAGRVRVDGRIVVDPAANVEPERVRINVDGRTRTRAAWRTILFHKPRGVVTTRSDPEGRRTVFDVLGNAGDGLIAIGRLDLATSGLLLLTTDTQFADRITNPRSGVARVYVATVRGRVETPAIEKVTRGIVEDGDRLRAHAVTVRKVSSRESHLVVELREGKNREVRRLFEAVGHPVTRLKRVKLGGLDLGDLRPGEWRELTQAEICEAFGPVTVLPYRPYRRC